jgi:hypothetical protein
MSYEPPNIPLGRRCRFATTIAGVIAVLHFANDHELDGNEWPDSDELGPDGWHYQLRQSTAKALEILAGEGARS